MPVAVLTAEELEALLERAVRKALAERPSAPAAAGWATPEQAAELLGTTAKTVRRWAAAGRIKATRDGSRWRISRAALPAEKPASPEALGRAAVVQLRR
jgi:excisionase family DNA binding protein